MVVKQVLMKITTVFRIALALCGLATCPKYRYLYQNGRGIFPENRDRLANAPYIQCTGVKMGVGYL